MLFRCKDVLAKRAHKIFFTGLSSLSQRNKIIG